MRKLTLEQKWSPWVCFSFITKYIKILHAKLEHSQRAKKIIFTACPSGKLKLAVTSPNVISASPKSFLTSRIDFTVLLLFEFLKKNITCPSGKLKIELTSPITKSTSPGLSDTTFFARWPSMYINLVVTYTDLINPG